MFFIRGYRLMDQAYCIDRDKITFEIVDNEALIIDLETGKYFSTSGTGCSVWRMLESGLTVREILLFFGFENSNLDQELTEGIKSFIGDLEKEGLIEPASEVFPGSECDFEAPSDLQLPVLEKFTDMQELLLIDPIHDVDSSGWPTVKEAPPESSNE